MPDTVWTQLARKMREREKEVCGDESNDYTNGIREGFQYALGVMQEVKYERGE